METGQIVAIILGAFLALAILWVMVFLFKEMKIQKKNHKEEMKKQKPYNSRLICDFMGYKIWKPSIARFKMFDHEMVTTPFGNIEFEILDEKFRTDWEWLHEITNKIGKIQFSEKDGMREYMAIEWRDSEINIYSTKKEVYEKIVNFIKWYNDN